MSTFRAMTTRERGRGAIIKMPGSDMSVRGTRDFTLVADRSGRYERLQVVMQVYNGANSRREARGEIKETDWKRKKTNRLPPIPNKKRNTFIAQQGWIARPPWSKRIGYACLSPRVFRLTINSTIYIHDRQTYTVAVDWRNWFFSIWSARRCDDGRSSYAYAWNETDREILNSVSNPWPEIN